MPSSFPLVAMSIMIIQIIYKIESDAFFASGLVMGFLLWEEGSGKQDLRASERLKLSFSGFCEIAACVNLGVTLEGLRGVENAARLSLERIVLIISSGRVLVFNCSLKARYQFCN